MLAALPGARIAPGLVRFQLAAVTCEGLQGQGLRWLQGARQGRGAVAGRVPRYRPWKAGAEALAEATRSQVVQVIGTKFVLYRETHGKPKEKRIRLVK